MERVLQRAIEASSLTEGMCDPTVLPSLLAIGYDRDFDELRRTSSIHTLPAVRPTGTSSLLLDLEHHTLTMPVECQLDLGATAKALTVDLVADDVMSEGGVVVEIGGDVALRGHGADGPWVIGIAESFSPQGSLPRIAFTNGGVATSSSVARSWTIDAKTFNHIIDPRTGTSTSSLYATATVSAKDCVTANAFSTAALVWGEEAMYHIAQAGWSARLVRHDGEIDYVGGWPVDEKAPA